MRSACCRSSLNGSCCISSCPLIALRSSTSVLSRSADAFLCRVACLLASQWAIEAGAIRRVVSNYKKDSHGNFLNDKFFSEAWASSTTSIHSQKSWIFFQKQQGWIGTTSDEFTHGGISVWRGFVSSIFHLVMHSSYVMAFVPLPRVPLSRSGKSVLEPDCFSLQIPFVQLLRNCVNGRWNWSGNSASLKTFQLFFLLLPASPKQRVVYNKVLWLFAMTRLIKNDYWLFC